ncbi:DUF3566 domain-containing protein [Rhodococcus tukisamuensis]|uniref:DUF3566 domain-containing protein n=1 Tax=Rhodococcus tukisamuensis TaxID=168276 RepID=UPI0031837A2A
MRPAQGQQAGGRGQTPPWQRGQQGQPGAQAPGNAPAGPNNQDGKASGQSGATQRPAGPQSTGVQPKVPPQGGTAQRPAGPQATGAQAKVPPQGGTAQRPAGPQATGAQAKVPPQGGTAQRPAGPQSTGVQSKVPPQGGTAQRPAQTGPQRPVTGQQPAAPKTAATGRVPAAAAADPAARAARKETAKAKAAVVDGPTRHIAREDLAKDLPDLSEVKHPLPVKPAVSDTAAQAALAVPVAVLPGQPMRAAVQIRRIDPWSTLKVSLVISVALFFVWMFAVGFLYVVLDGMGVWDRLNNAFTDFVSESSSSGLVTAGQVFGYSALVGAANVVLFTALATIGSFIYNLCTDLVGGVEVTLADRD